VKIPGDQQFQKYSNQPIRHQQSCHNQSHWYHILSLFRCLMWTLTEAPDLYLNDFMHFIAATWLADWIIAWIRRSTCGPNKVLSEHIIYIFLISVNLLSWCLPAHCTYHCRIILYFKREVCANEFCRGPSSHLPPGNIPKAGQKCIRTYNNCLWLFPQTEQQGSPHHVLQGLRQSLCRPMLSSLMKDKEI